MTPDEVSSTSAGPRRPQPAAVLLCALGLLAGTLLLYAPVGGFEFLGYDDYLYVRQPVVQRGVTLEGLLWTFQVGPGRIYFHPLTWSTHMLDHVLFGERAGPHHLVNVVYHATGAVLLMLVTWRSTGRFWPSALIAALFAWHPLHVQSVAWVAERKDVVSGIAFALALWTYAWYASRPGAGRYAAVVAVVALALAAKPTLVTLPCLFLVLDYWPLRRPIRPRLVLEKLPLLAMALGTAVISYRMQQHESAIQSSDAFPLPFRLANAVVSYVRYLYKTIVPVRLSIFDPPQSWAAWQVAGAAAILVGITAICIRQVRRRPYLLAGWLWFLGMLVPMIGVIQAGAQSVADRYTYLPLTGLFIMAAWLLAEWTAEDPRRRRAAVAVAGVALALCVVGTRYQLRFWRDELTVFSRALEVTRENSVAHGFVAKNLADRNEPEQAAYHYREALRISPGYVEGHFNFANLLRRYGQLDASIEHYRRAIALRPDVPAAHNNLGAALAARGDTAGAEAAFRAAVSLDPADGQAHLNHGRALRSLGRHGEAAQAFERAFMLRPALRDTTPATPSDRNPATPP